MTEIVFKTPEGAVPRAFAVLELISSAAEPMRLSAIAARLGLEKSTVHRILAMLNSLGYVEQDDRTLCYKPTLKIWEIGSQLIASHPIKQAAAVSLQRLHLATRETVSLTILAGDDVLYLDKLVSPRPIRLTSRVGSRAPAALTAGGKAMLAYASDARAIIERTRQRIESKRKLSLEALLRELAAIRREGYGSSSFRAGVISFGAPIMGRDGGAPAAISVSAPESRLDPARRANIIENLLVAAAEIAERAGFSVESAEFAPITHSKARSAP
jgi:DNA-binding IclR family transcriptional regulator